MNVVALIVAIVAVACFLRAALSVPKAWLVPLGLALFAASFIVQLVFPVALVVHH